MDENQAAGFCNRFGEVASDRIVFNVKKSLFSGTVREDFPMRHITSIRHETKRWPIWGVLLGLVGLALLASDSFFFGLVLVAIAALLLVGTPAVSIQSAGGENRTSVGAPFSGEEAQQYANAVRQALFAKE